MIQLINSEPLFNFFTNGNRDSIVIFLLLVNNSDAGAGSGIRNVHACVHVVYSRSPFPLAYVNE